MRSPKISISLSSELLTFIEHYQQKNNYHSRSQVITEAIRLLQTQELENAYRDASQEVDDGWEVTTADGLSDETW